MSLTSTWPLIVERLQESGKPWEHEMMVEDLAWWDDQRRFAKKKRPGRGALQKRWNCNEWDARKALRDPAWRDRGKPEEDPPEALQGSSSGSPEPLQTDNGQTSATGENTPEPLQLFSSDPPEALLTRDDPPTPTHNTTTVVVDLPIPTYLVSWLRLKQARGRPKHVTQAQLLRYVVDGVTAITGKPPPRVPAEGYGRPLLNLWARMGFLPLGLDSEGGAVLMVPQDATASASTALGVVSLLSAACRECPAKPFREDVRGFRPDGTTWKSKPLRMVPAIVCRLDPPRTGGGMGATVEDRLEVAKAWDAEGRPMVDDERPLPEARTADPSDYDAACKASGHDEEENQRAIERIDDELDRRNPDRPDRASRRASLLGLPHDSAGS